MNAKLFGERLYKLRKEHDLTQEQVADYVRSNNPDSRADKSLISRYEKEGVEPKQFYTVQILAELFGVNVNYMSGSSDSKYGDDADCRLVPILGTIAAGVPILAQEDIQGQEPILPNENIQFCLKVKGDSMINARIYDGDIVYIRKQPEVENGEIAAIIIDAEDATLKRVYRVRGAVILRAENPAYEDIVIEKKDMKTVQVLGKAVYFKSEVK